MKTIIQDDLKDAMRTKDAVALNVLRSLKTSITNASLQKGNIDEEVSEVEIIGIIRKEISKRNDSIQAFISGNRPELADKEKVEISFLQKYLPTEWSDQELRDHVSEAIANLNATSKKDMGGVIKCVVEKANGKADNKRISSIVGSLLS
jgi:uncharacterized protein YqeY